MVSAATTIEAATAMMPTPVKSAAVVTAMVSAARIPAVVVRVTVVTVIMVVVWMVRTIRMFRICGRILIFPRTRQPEPEAAGVVFLAGKPALPAVFPAGPNALPLDHKEDNHYRQPENNYG